MSTTTENNQTLSDVEELLTKEFQAVDSVLAKFRTDITAMQSRLRSLERSAKRELRALKKQADKNKRAGNRKPSGFATPAKISSELCEFMGKEEGAEVARTEVTQFVISYIKDNNLGVSKEIKLDDKLKSLLGATSDDQVTYFNLQRYMNKHFVKPAKATKGTKSSTSSA